MSDRLLVALRDLPVEWPEVPAVGLGGAVRSSDGVGVRPPSFVSTRVAVAVLLIVLGVVGLVAPVREAVADWLGIGVVRIELVGELPSDLGMVLDLGDPIEIAATALVWPEALGQPDAAFARDGEVSVVWAPSSDLPEVADSGVGAILTRFDGTLDPAVEKSIGAGSTLSVVTIDGERAYWIEGEPHSFAYVDSSGRVIASTPRLAGNVLIWDRDGATYRFESGLALDEVVALFG